MDWRPEHRGNVRRTFRLPARSVSAVQNQTARGRLHPRPKRAGLAHGYPESEDYPSCKNSKSRRNKKNLKDERETYDLCDVQRAQTLPRNLLLAAKQISAGSKDKLVQARH